MQTVLVVDDEADVRLIARVVLQADGWEVQEAASGEAALAYVEANGLPDLLLLDVRMPGIDGWEVLRALRAAPDRADLPVVVFTADLGARSEAPAQLLDRDVMLAKPFLVDDLLRVVRDLVPVEG